MHDPDRDRAQRDLLWCLHSPALVRADETFPTDTWFQSQVVSGTQIAPPPAKFRLGIHFEKIFQAWLEQHPSYKLAAANLQIQSLERTLGEFDLLVDSNGEIEHWELAVKFYINCQNPADAGQWYGPDPADTFKGKVDRLTQHQLKLAELAASQTLLQSMDLTIDRVRCIIKGRLYYPFDQPGEKIAPKIANPNHLSGWWLKQDDLDELADRKIVYLEKKYWLSALTSSDQVTIMSIEEVRNFLTRTKQIAPQFALLDKDLNETSRGFILKSEWFQKAGIN